jgi:hypothetical protein
VSLCIPAYRVDTVKIKPPDVMAPSGIVAEASTSNECYLQRLSKSEYEPFLEYDHNMLSSRPRLNAISGSYTLVRLEHSARGGILKLLNEELLEISLVAGVQELNDESLELVVYKKYLPTLLKKLGKISPGLNVDLNYNPVQPIVDDEKERALSMHSFLARADIMIKEAWPVAAAYYFCLVNDLVGPSRCRL